MIRHEMLIWSTGLELNQILNLRIFMVLKMNWYGYTGGNKVDAKGADDGKRSGID
ncbi:MAG: hypothetical protein WDZ35_07625 [Crocinitomicaceae bacterium]